MLTQGPKVMEFEDALCREVGSTFAVAVNSATSALHIAYLALGLSRGDILWTSAITFVATSNAALLCGAEVEFLDIDDATLNICPPKLEERLIAAKAAGRLPKIVTVVHMCGTPANLGEIRKLSREYGFLVVEDASHAVGASYEGHSIGSCSHSDVSVFSFHPVKIVTSGEGGVATTNDKEIAKRMAMFRSHGISRQASEFVDTTKGAWHYEQHFLGLNYRMTDIEAALGISQLKRVQSFVRERKSISDRYREQLNHLKFQQIAPAVESSHHLEIIRVPSQIRRDWFDYLRLNGIGVNVHYLPVYLHPYYQKLRRDWDVCSAAEKYYSEAISIPIFVGLSDTEQSRIVELLSEVRFGGQTTF